ncbi:60S ribosomal protein L7 [Paragonimus heterotremus]|uniref:60S ribosomal protein L7 n=1 Tax=Paragonimus heterotremus TaxID=100268 RepID=A0A8J4WEX7_9TREM|nr:60S ribosomal protein L7 [Paragonimus heterotremus]
MDDKVQLRSLPVTLLKRRKRTNKDIIKQQRERSEQLRKRAKARRSQIRRPAFFIASARKRARDGMRVKRVLARKKPLFVTDVPRLGLVVRLKREDVELSDECIEVFRLLRLDTYNQAVFVKITQPMLELLSLVEPYIAWGYPTLQTVREILTKRGRTVLDHRKQSIDNKVIESKLGQFGILCLEDLVHELITVGPQLRSVLQFLQPFKLMPPSKSWLFGSKRCHSTADKLTGMREENINEMVRRMI